MGEHAFEKTPKGFHGQIPLRHGRNHPVGDDEMSSRIPNDEATGGAEHFA